jgi:CheY-like chemotaxis protein
VVEDDEDVRGLLRDLLDLEGYEVLSATNGRDALAQLRAGARPCLILLDLMMPVMDGWSFEGERRRDPDLASIPVVVLTGAGSRNAGGLCVERVLEKPVDLDTLLPLVQRFC